MYYIALWPNMQIMQSFERKNGILFAASQKNALKNLILYGSEIHFETHASIYIVL